MKIVAGLGNPGARYRGTRHNVGFEVVDLLARRLEIGFDAAPADAVQARWRVGDDVVLLVKPLTFMNVSGQAVGSLMRYYKVAQSDVLIVCDDVNLQLGRLRLRARGSDGGHNGLKSMAVETASLEYARLRVGVGRGDGRRDLSGHVVARFEPEEDAEIQTAIVRAADAVEMWRAEGVLRAMNVFNRPVDAGTGEEPEAG
jgi:PTH1 family peptidyl-tRNA hydrolase